MTIVDLEREWIVVVGATGKRRRCGMKHLARLLSRVSPMLHRGDVIVYPAAWGWSVGSLKQLKLDLSR